MKKWLFLVPMLVLPIILISTAQSDEQSGISGPQLGTSSILAVGESFVQLNSNENSTEEKILGTFREITEEEILEESRLPDLEKSEMILENGIRLSANYNQISYDYSNEKFSDFEYLGKLMDFRIKYEKYLTAVDAYIGKEDILVQKNSMIIELDEINKQIILLKNSENILGHPDFSEQNDKFKKFLPPMFAP